jgi:hypothetical protein
MRLDNEAKRLALKEKEMDLQTRQLAFERQKLELAIFTDQNLAPNMSEQERLVYVIELMKPLNTLINSPLELGRPQQPST